MTAAVRALATLEELGKYVHETLCEHDVLEPANSPLFQAPIKRSGRVCGLFFQVGWAAFGQTVHGLSRRRRSHPFLSSR